MPSGSRYLEGFGVRVTPRSPAIVMRLGGAAIDELRVHRMEIGSASIAPTEGKIEISILSGLQESIMEIAPGDEEREWRVVTDGLSCILPPEMAVFLGDSQDPIEFRFNRLVADASIPLPNGTLLPYGEDVIVICPPKRAKLPRESELTDELRRSEALRSEKNMLLGVRTLNGSKGRIRVIDISSSPDQNGVSKRHLLYLIARGSNVVTLTLIVNERGVEVARTFADVLANSIRILKSK